MDVYVSGDYAYVACGNPGLAIIDVSDLINPGTPGGPIPIGNYFLIFIGFSVIGLIFAKKRQIIRESR